MPVALIEGGGGRPSLSSTTDVVAPYLSTLAPALSLPPREDPGGGARARCEGSNAAPSPFWSSAGTEEYPMSLLLLLPPGGGGGAGGAPLRPVIADSAYGCLAMPIPCTCVYITQTRSSVIFLCPLGLLLPSCATQRQESSFSTLAYFLAFKAVYRVRCAVAGLAISLSMAPRGCLSSLWLVSTFACKGSKQARESKKVCLWAAKERESRPWCTLVRVAIPQR